MKDIKDFYILGIPVETDLGECHFLKVSDYPDYFMDLQTISLTKNHLISKYKEFNKKEKDLLLEQAIEEMEKADLFTLALSIPELQEAYLTLFTKVFDSEDVFFEITKESEGFYYYRNLVMEMNCMKEEKINPNPEIQKAIERSRRVKGAEGDSLQFADIVTSCVGYNGLSYKDINEFTVYQLYATFYRIAQIKNYDTSTLFATVAEKVQIDSWSKHIDLFAEDYHTISKEDFQRKGISLFGGKE